MQHIGVLDGAAVAKGCGAYKMAGEKSAVLHPAIGYFVAAGYHHFTQALIFFRQPDGERIAAAGLYVLLYFFIPRVAYYQFVAAPASGKVKLPSFAVMVPRVVFCANTDAPSSGAAVSASITRPESWYCANRLRVLNKAASRSRCFFIVRLRQ